MGGGGGGPADIFDLFGMGGGRRGSARERRSEDVVHKCAGGGGPSWMAARLPPALQPGQAAGGAVLPGLPSLSCRCPAPGWPLLTFCTLSLTGSPLFLPAG